MVVHTQGKPNALPGRRGHKPLRDSMRIPILLFVLVLGVVLLASCGNGDEVTQEPAESALPEAGAPTPLQPIQPDLPCFVSPRVEKSAEPVVSPTPQVVHIQLLEHPYRVVPNDIVLEENSQYRLIVQAGNETHGFRVLPLGLDYEIPPGGQIDVVVRPLEPGIFPIENWRRMPESELISTITVVPEGVAAATWNSLCGHIQVHSPPPSAELGAPFVIEGSVARASGASLHITRVEAWSDGQQVGVVTRDQFVKSYIAHSDFRARAASSSFFLAIPKLAPGTHDLLLKAYLQNGTLTATTLVPLTVLPSDPSGSLLPGYRGNIDLPLENELLSLPVTVQGWAVIPGSKLGTGVGAVEVWNGPRETGQYLTEAAYGLYRSDVAEEFGEPFLASSGFIAQLDDLPAGEVTLYFYVRDRETGDYVSPRFRQPSLTQKIRLAEGKVTDAAWPVALAAAPDGRLFFAELLTGRIMVLQDGQVLPEPFATLKDVTYHRESGLLGLALHPDFPQEPYLYAMYVVRDVETDFPRMQRVVRFRDVDNVGQAYTVILDNLPYAIEGFHNGGRIVFGTDGKLYLSLGDIWIEEYSQDPARLPGSILRYNLDGSIPIDNPDPSSPVYAIGFRNVFGLAVQPNTGFLYATENGPAGFDEVNKVEAGQNYGWPLHMGVTNAEGFIDPIAVFGNWPELPIAPTGATFTTEQPDLLLLCGFTDFYLRGVRLESPDYDSVDSKLVLSTNCALDVTYSSDGWLYYSTPSAIYRARLDDLLRLQEKNSGSE